MKRRTNYNGLLFIGIAFLAFIVIGLTISSSIRACAHHKRKTTERILLNEAKNINIDRELEQPLESQEINTQYVMPDSIILICMPKPLDGISEQILYRTSYIVSYNRDTKIPNWVAWNLTADHTDGPYNRLGNFHEDEDVMQPRATIEDYRGCGWSRGHMCPAGDNKWDESAMYDTFSLTNVCPQNANLNSGLWNSIEMDCRKWARRFGDVYIICGPVFMNREHEIIGGNQIYVPEAFFKVVLWLSCNSPWMS